MNEVEIIMRRKVKRIERAAKLLNYMKVDIEHTKMREEDKAWLLQSVDAILKYLENDDKEENMYNYDDVELKIIPEN